MNTIICEQTPHGEICIDVYTKLSSDRILFINGFIDDDIATDICANLLLKDSENHNKITLFINSEENLIKSTFMILDVMEVLKSPIETICSGSAFDGAALILASGTKGMRFCTKNSTIMCGQLIADYSLHCNLTTANDALKRSQNDNKKVMKIISDKTFIPLKEVSKRFDRKIYMNAKDGLKFGFFDKIIKTK